MKKHITFFFLVSIALIFSGCAGGHSADYSNLIIPVNFESEIKLAVGVTDNRPFIMDGSKHEQYVGTMYSLAHVPWNMNTRSGKPFAEDVLKSLTASLNQKGFDVLPVALSKNDDKNGVMVKLKKANRERILLFTIIEWYSTVYFGTNLYYDLKLETFDKSGNFLASANQADNAKGLGVKDSNDGLYPRYMNAFSALLNTPIIMESLTTDNIKPTVKTDEKKEIQTTQEKNEDDIKKKLIKLKDLLDSGLITQEDYDMQKAKLLKDL